MDLLLSDVTCIIIHSNGAPLAYYVDSTYEQLVLSSVLLGFPGGAFAPDLVNQTQHLFASHQGDSLRELASVAVDHPMTSEGLVDASAGDSHPSLRLPSTRERGFYIFSRPTRLYRCARVVSNLVT